MKSFNVIWQDFNRQRFEAYDVMPYFVDEYHKVNNKPKTFDEFKEFVKNESMYMFWGRCQYEIIICGWPNEDTQEKWDIHKQIMMNINIVTNILMENVNGNTESEVNQ